VAADDPARASPATPAYALLIDGSTVEIRSAGPGDTEAVRAMHAALSPRNAYLRFFNLSSLNAEREARRVCREPGPDHAALLAWLGGELAGVASYEPAHRPGTAEIALAIPDHLHGRGIGTLLLEHLVSIARRRKLRAFTAVTLAENAAMLAVFAAAGLPVQRRSADSEVQLTFPLPAGEADRRLEDYLDSVAARESRADVASLRHLLRPDSIAVAGASRSRASAGREILRNIVTGGFGGPVYPVNPHVPSLEGLPCVPDAEDLPQHVDLAVIAVPAAALPEVAAACGRRGVRTLVVITGELGAEGHGLLATCRRYGMRLVGPNCFGIAVPAISLDATFGASRPLQGVAGLVVQSGGIGVSFLKHLSELGIGVSSFVSVGDKYDVSSNDMLTWWEQDGQTRLAVLYVESFGSPRKFARTARRVGHRIPVLTVISGRSVAGQRAAASHTAAAATPLVTQEALFGQAGVIAATNLGELLEAAALLASQPLPLGDRVAIVSNAGGGGVLAADACADHGLRVATMSGPTQRTLRALLPTDAATAGPVDTTAAVRVDAFGSCLREVAADDGVDAVLAVTVPTAMADPSQALATAGLAKPLAAAILDQTQTVRLLPAARRPAPGPPGDEASDDEAPRAGTPAAGTPGAGTPGAGTPAAGTPAAETPGDETPGDETPGDETPGDETPGDETPGDETPGDEAAAAQPVPGIPAYAYPESAARALGHAARYHAWRTRQHGRVPELPGVRADAARAQVSAFLAAAPAGGWLSPAQVGDLLTCYQIAPPRPVPAGQAGGGVEVFAGVRQEAVFGPVVVFGLSGIAGEAVGDCAARLTPLTDTDAADMIHEGPAAPVLAGPQGRPAADTGALAGLLLRVSRLAEDLPEVAELDLDPVIAGPDGVRAVAARIRLSPGQPQDPFLRRLR
jgi:acyl-CoA synthetase (NDP forming)/GNAT superfamily N-acetyltransferase